MSSIRGTEQPFLFTADPLEPRVAAYGTWHSPISAGTVASGALRLSRVVLDADDIYWIEGRPAEGGRNVVVKRHPAGHIVDVTPASTNVRTRVHEYGGAAYVVSGGIVYYSEFADQRVYKLEPGGVPEAVTPPGDWCYADGCLNPSKSHLVLVREDHTTKGREPVTTLVSVALDAAPSAGIVIASGHDFYSTPRFSPDGAQLSWLAWNQALVSDPVADDRRHAAVSRDTGRPRDLRGRTARIPQAGVDRRLPRGRAVFLRRSVRLSACWYATVNHDYPSRPMATEVTIAWLCRSAARHRCALASAAEGSCIIAFSPYVTI